MKGFKKADRLSSEHGVSIDVVLGTGRIYDQIVGVAQDTEASQSWELTVFLVFAEFFAGSNAFKVVTRVLVQSLPCKRPGSDTGFKNIVMPIDATDETRQKVPVAATLAQMFDATVHIASLITDDTPEMHHKFTIMSRQIAEYFDEREISHWKTRLPVIIWPP